MDETTGKPIVRLRSSFIDDLAKIREHAVEGANSLKITITGDCDKETLETFKKA
ncbi:MAG: hypothetical protein MJ223_03670 [Mycoplasmoidaceae bacterium]|nr:hypothetical protein [Mycoplasmoidaceae bacterium]